MSAMHLATGTTLGGAATGFLVASLEGHLHESPQTAAGDAGLIVIIIGAIWALATWLIAWRWPKAPQIPGRETAT